VSRKNREIKAKHIAKQTKKKTEELQRNTKNTEQRPMKMIEETQIKNTTVKNNI
jgi:hypothetical protein